MIGPRPQTRPAPVRMERHAYQKGTWPGSERCSVHVPGRGTRERCDLMWHNPIHRFYYCDGCGRFDFASVEMRDRHHADVHGSGW